MRGLEVIGTMWISEVGVRWGREGVDGGWVLMLSTRGGSVLEAIGADVEKRQKGLFWRV